MVVEIMDTTLRDGEQTQGVSYTPLEKLHVAKLRLKDLKVDRIEVSSARVSTGEFEAIKQITEWARHNNFQRKVEVLGFVDGDLSIKWIDEAGGKVINLLCKGSLRHLEKQLRKTPEQHVTEIKEIIKKAASRDMQVNIYLEDWSNGMISSEKYVYYMLNSLKNEKIEIQRKEKKAVVLSFGQWLWKLEDKTKVYEFMIEYAQQKNLVLEK
jgi:D-citramalate synthase